MTEYERLLSLLASAEKIAEEYPGSRTLGNIIENIKQRVDYYDRKRV